MLENNKCILAYGLSDLELEKLRELKFKVIEVTPEMCEMTLNDILSGLRLDIFNNSPLKEKVILYNNLTEIEVKKVINDTREGIKDGILAVVTEQSINWKVNYLIKHLKNERDWYSKVRKEIKDE